MSPMPYLFTGERQSYVLVYKSYTFNSDLYMLSDTFEVVMDRQSYRYIARTITPGSLIEATFADSQYYQFRGILEDINISYDKNSTEVTLSGRDLSALLVDSYCTTYKDYKNELAGNIITELIDQVTALDEDLFTSNPFQLLNIEAVNREALSEVVDSFKVSPGDTIADKLLELSVKTGNDIAYLESGNIFYGDLNAYRDYEINQGIAKKHYLTMDKFSSKQQIIKSATFRRETAGLYRTYKVVGTDQNGNSVSATATDPTSPLKKTYVTTFNDSQSRAEKQAVELREQNIQDSIVYEYTVAGNDQDGQVWNINRRVTVRDTIIGATEELIVRTRSLNFDINNGTTTNLSLIVPKDYISIRQESYRSVLKNSPSATEGSIDNFLEDIKQKYQSNFTE